VFTIDIDELNTTCECLQSGKVSHVKYLKLPISFKKLIKEELSGSIGKVQKRLKTWKCNQLSHGGGALSSI